MTELELHHLTWDCCVVGNGVAPLWLAHWLWSSKKSVLWVTSDQPYDSARAALQQAWSWGVDQEVASFLLQHLKGFAGADEELPLFEAVYFDARSSHKRFRKLKDAKVEWGKHEKVFFESLVSLSEQEGKIADLWSWHERLHAFHDSGQNQGPVKIELFSEPRFVRVQGWPILELKTEADQITGITLAGLKPQEATEIQAAEFYLADYDEAFSTLVKDTASAESLSAAFKGRSYRAGFGLRLWHKPLETAPDQVMVVPLVVNPSKGGGSHLIGRFKQTNRGLESFWAGLLTDEEVEDNNEILKKIKLSKRALDRAIPGLMDSIEREAMSFEPRMRAMDLVKNRKTEALGALLVSDHYGTEAAAQALKNIFSGTEDKKKAKKAPSSPTPSIEASL